MLHRRKRRKNKQQHLQCDLHLIDSWGLKELQISNSCNKSKSSSTASYSVNDSLRLSKHALEVMHAFWRKGNITE